MEMREQGLIDIDAPIRFVILQNITFFGKPRQPITLETIRNSHAIIALT